MQVEVRLFANLRQMSPGGFLEQELEEGSTVWDLIETIKLTEEKALIIMVNGRREEMNKVLQDGDRIGIFPPVGGG